MGITNENDRTAIYYAINPEELDSLGIYPWFLELFP